MSQASSTGPDEAFLADESPDVEYILGLYISGPSALSRRAVVNTRRICDQYLGGRYQLEVVDLCQHPEVAVREQIIGAPTLVKKHPLPVRRFVGDMSRVAVILQGLGVTVPGAE